MICTVEREGNPNIKKKTLKLQKCLSICMESNLHFSILEQEILPVETSLTVICMDRNRMYGNKKPGFQLYAFLAFTLKSLGKTSAGCPRITNKREFSFRRLASRSSRHWSRNLQKKWKEMFAFWGRPNKFTVETGIKRNSPSVIRSSIFHAYFDDACMSTS